MTDRPAVPGPPGGSNPTVCVVGAGAVGSMIGAMLSASGVPTTALARGRTLDSLRHNGWRFQRGESLITGPVRADADPAELGTADVVVLAVKAQSLPELAPALTPLIGDGTVVVPAMNGVPWWFCDGLGGPVDGLRLSSVDPGGAVADALPPSAVLGCVVHLSASTPSPGVSVHGAGQRLILGEPGGGPSDRLRRVTELLRDAGFEVEESARIQDDVWFKLWGNLTMNPISMLTGATMDQILDDDLVAAFVASAMAEARELGARIGTPLQQSIPERIEVTRRLGAMRTSMLQDADAGRQIELDALVSAVREIGQAVAMATPTIDTLLGLTRLAARTRGLYPS